ncbi:epsin-1 isoform X2 [Anopheles stephensi]|nr:epsin-1 isoform X2 [Anopheles stephensi]XP_035914065.1 epsin-1 isoform X2 [Anopheles stephensi]
MNVAGIRRNIKNIAHNYSDAQVKVREATSNDPWGPSSTIMAEIADLTYNVVAFSEIMQMIWKRMNDHGKNWRHVYKALLLLEYLIKTGTEKVAQQCKENIYAIQTLKEFQYMEEGKDQGMHVREKAKQLVSLLKDDERLKNERARALKAKERFARTASGFGSDGSIDGPTQRDPRPPNWGEGEPIAGAATSGVGKPVSEIEFVRPQTVGEEELQLQLAMAMSREEAEQEEQKRRSDDVRLQLALSQSEQDFKKDHDPKAPQEGSSALVDLLDISFGAASISSPSQQPLAGPSGAGAPIDPWGMPVAGGSRPTTSDPWSRTSSPPAVVDPWLNTASALPTADPSTSKPPLLGADAWQPRTQSPSVTSGSSVEGWLQNGAGAGAAGGSTMMNGAGATNGNLDPWYSKTNAVPLGVTAPPQATAADPWQANKRSTPVPTAGAAGGDPWQSTASAAKLDPWAPVSNNSNTGSVGDLEATFGGGSAPLMNRPSPVGAITSPVSDLDEFDIITKRAASNNSSSSTNNNNNHNAASNNLNNNSSLLLGDLDPLSSSSSPSMGATTAAKKTPQSFLGENSALVNLDNLIKPMPSGGGVAASATSSAAYNPFGDTGGAGAAPVQKNLFQQNQPQVPSINQLKQSPFPVTLNQDPWAPVSNMATAQQPDEDETECFPYPPVDVNANSDYPQQQEWPMATTNRIPAAANLSAEHIDCRLSGDTGVTGEDDIFNTNYAMLPPASGSTAPGNLERHLTAAQLDSTRPLRQLYDFHFAVDEDALDVVNSGPVAGGGGGTAFATSDAMNRNDNHRQGANATFTDSCHANNNYQANLNNNNSAPWMNPQSSNPFLS